MTRDPAADAPPTALLAGQWQAQRRLAVLVPYWQQLVRLAARKGAGQEAEDIATDAILRALRAAGLDEQDPLNYLQRTVQNLVIDRYRHACDQHRLSRYAGLAPPPQAVEDGVADHDLAVRALQRLRDTEGPVTAMLVWRRAVDELSWSELATEVGMSPSQVQSRVWRALRNLRPWLRRQLPN